MCGCVQPAGPSFSLRGVAYSGYRRALALGGIMVCTILLMKAHNIHQFAVAKQLSTLKGDILAILLLYGEIT